jgi:hypothetical protein
MRILARAALLLLLAPGAARADDAWPRVDVSVHQATGLPALEMRAGDAWTQTPCVMPCTLRLDPAREYRISGDGVVDSEPFRLPPSADRAKVDVSPGSTLVRGIGTYLTIGGVLFAGAGGAVLLWPRDEHASSDAATSKVVVGAGCLAMGVLAAAIGLVIHATSDTSVRVQAEP